MNKRRPSKKPLPAVPLPIRMFLLAIIAVTASVYALIRFYTHPRPPMLVPVDASEIPAPELEPLSD